MYTVGERCVPIKKKFVNYMAGQFPEFAFEGSSSQFYAFRRENADSIYDHIIVQREFYEGMIGLVVTEVASCYNQSWKGIPWFTVGLDTDIGVLITGKNRYDANTGWHRCKNSAEELPRLFEEIRTDIDTYVMAFFEKSHHTINADKRMTATGAYMKAQLTALSEDEAAAVKEYLGNVSQAYMGYSRDCKKSGQRETTEYFDIIPLHPIVERWVSELQKALNYSSLSKNMRTRLIKDTTVLFRDQFDFYNLR